ncbi:MAG: hypothetical protein WCR20_06115, partial [Verrucomicrobiota bacterium]
PEPRRPPPLFSQRTPVHSVVRSFATCSVGIVRVSGSGWHAEGTDQLAFPGEGVGMDECGSTLADLPTVQTLACD